MRHPRQALSRPHFALPLSLVVLGVLAIGLAAPGCATIESLTGMDSLTALGAVPEVLQQVTALTGDIGDWSSGLMGFINDPQMDQLGGFVNQAGELLSSLGNATSNLGDTEPTGLSGLSTITDKLGELAAFRVQDLFPLPQSERMTAVDGFTGIADSLGKLATDFLASR